MYSSDKQDSNKVWYSWFQVVIIFDSVQSSDHICIKSIWQLMPEPNIENTAATHIAAPRHQWYVASAWFLMVVFPFNFAHFADVVPDFLAFLISWITNDIARVLLAIGMVGGVVSVGINTVLYIKVRAFLLQQSGSTRVVH